MKNLIRFIRAEANMSQEQFASALGSTPASINRWENGKTIPSQIAQKSLFEFCVKQGIDLSSLILSQRTVSAQKDQLILYHGSKEGIVGGIAPTSRNECDFGAAFYMGTVPLQPLTLVCAEEKPVLYTVSLDLTGLKVLDIEIDLDWAMLIAYNRKEMEFAAGSSIYEKYYNFSKGYDIVHGYIANDRMYTELSRFFEGTRTDVALMKCLSALDLGMQYAAITEKACSRISVLSEHRLQPLELYALREKSKIRREEGLALADEVAKKYRREGRFFDEIMKG